MTTWKPIPEKGAESIRLGEEAYNAVIESGGETDDDGVIEEFLCSDMVTKIRVEYVLTDGGDFIDIVSVWIED